MTIISAVAAALLLASDPAPTPVEAVPSVPPEALQATPAPPPASSAVSGLPVASVTAPVESSGSSKATQTERLLRAGIGFSVTNADSGFASTFQAGVQVDPWSAFGFRASMGMTTSVVGAGGWDAAEFSASALWRPLGNNRRVVPYLGLGAQFAFLAIFPDPVPPPPPVASMGAGHLGVNLASAPAENPDKVGDSPYGTNQFTLMPEATVGALIKFTPSIGLDVAARYLPLFWSGTVYNGFSVVASIATPF